MSNFDDNDIHCGIYRTNDPISNFKIRVKLERLTSNSLLPSLERLKIREDLSRLLGNDGQPIEKPKASRTEIAQVFDETKNSEYEEVVIGWQQKLFSRSEFEKYGRNVGPHSTAIKQKYFDAIQKMKADSKQPGRIFTYIESDPYGYERHLDYFITDSPNEQPSRLALGIDNVRKRHVVQTNFKQSNKQYLQKTNLINQKPTFDIIRTNHFTSLPYQTMYLMADLSQTINTTTDVSQSTDEHVLCRIDVYSNGTIILEPDFNNGKLAYLVETGKIDRAFYQYYLEHASISITNDYLIKERRLMNEICTRQQIYLSNIVGNEFDIPPPTVLKLNVFGEIISGKNFDFDNTYVYYCLDLTNNWYVESSTILSGYTHTASATTSSKYDDIVYYSHPFEFELWYKPPRVSADHELPRMPKIFFQISSLDSWGRHRIEGYTYIDIPSSPGFYNEHLSCWRPRGNSIYDELRRFYIGGSPELEDISYVAIPKLFESEPNNTLLSRFGFRTVSTGELNIRLNVVFQSQSLAKEHTKQRSTHTVSRHGFDAFMSNINDTLYEYDQAKKRALEVREKTRQNFQMETL
ncbi:unnamed protein product [Rotaria sordida]|uniref:Meckel syndrome type 1 protein n=1 Tax=Rotaria sordida TaxID=392033 RepID=A0A814BGW3_9BILA|nr:unnamed protein product [Rotaria sordida]CAF3687231.1 unnamed protein product [Rotaria sordida]